MPRAGVLIVGFGGPDSPEAVAPFMRNLMGREPADALVERTQAKYAQIGGRSPLLDIAQALGDGIGEALSEVGSPLPVAIGMRYWHPFISDAIDTLATAGVDLVVMVSLSPYEAAVTHGEYRSAVEAALRDHPGMRVADAPLLSAVPAFIDLQTAGAEAALSSIDMPGAPLVFSAHSLPMSDIEADDSYVRGLQTAAAEIASRLGLPEGSRAEVLPGSEAFGSASGARPWLVAYQSQGARGGEWLGPDLDAIIDAVAAQNLGGLVVVPLGFATDHMETRYDLDTVAQRRAEGEGLTFIRSALPNAHPALARGIARAVVEAVTREG